MSGQVKSERLTQLSGTRGRAELGKVLGASDAKSSPSFAKYQQRKSTYTSLTKTGLRYIFLKEHFNEKNDHP